MVIYYAPHSYYVEKITDLADEPPLPFNMSLEEKTDYYLTEHNLAWGYFPDEDVPDYILDSQVELGDNGKIIGFRDMESDTSLDFDPETPIDIDPDPIVLAQLVAAKKTSEKMMKNKELTTMEIDTTQHLLDAYIREGQKYYVGDVFRWNNWPYEVIKNHQSVYELEPHHRDAEQYYKKIMPKGSIPV